MYVRVILRDMYNIFRSFTSYDNMAWNLLISDIMRLRQVCCNRVSYFLKNRKFYVIIDDVYKNSRNENETCSIDTVYVVIYLKCSYTVFYSHTISFIISPIDNDHDFSNHVSRHVVRVKQWLIYYTSPKPLWKSRSKNNKYLV